MASSGRDGHGDQWSHRKFKPTNTGDRNAFKERLVKQCAERIKQQRKENFQRSREAQLESLGETCRQTLTQEIQKYCSPVKSKNQAQHSAAQNDFGIDFGELSGAEYEEVLLLLQEVIAEESRHMEVDMIEESDANSSQWEDDRFLEEWVMHVDPDQPSSSDAVMCPMCQQNRLLQNMSVIFCKCGFRLDSGHDCISLDYLQKQLYAACRQHSSQCGNDPEFCMNTNNFGFTGLYLICKHCNCKVLIV